MEADDFRAGMVVAEFNGPNAGSAADIEDFARVVADGGEIVFVAEADAQHLVDQIEAVQFALEEVG